MRISTLETIHTTLIRRRDQLKKIITKEEEYLAKMIATTQEKAGKDCRDPMNILDGFIAEDGPDNFGKVTGIYAEDKELCDKYDVYTKLRQEEVDIRQALEDFERQNW